MTTQTESLKRYLDDCDKHAIVPDIAGAFHFAWQEALAQPEKEPVSWKLVPVQPTEEMLKAMDECSTEGYDERLYAGHAASVYMAAVDVAPSPPQPKEPEQEPVAYIKAAELDELKHCNGMSLWAENAAVHTDDSISKQLLPSGHVPVYTTPPRRKPLSDWIDPNDKTQKQYLPNIGEPVLFCHEGKTYYGKHNGGSFQYRGIFQPQYFSTWECRWMPIPAAHGIKE